jgi:phosphoserine aminotransferase
MVHRIHNFSAGPCTLPLEILQEVEAEFVDYQDSGMSLIEMSHRGKHFEHVYQTAVRFARKVFQVPDNFSVLFLQGGATLQFSMVPMNLITEGMRAAYVNSGSWASGAIEDAKIYGNVYIAWDGKECNYFRMPLSEEINLQADTRYLHITSNETIGGIRFLDWPEVETPLVADMSSDYMSRRIPWERFDLVYGGVQKNLGPAGMAIVFIRDSALDNGNRNLGRYLRYDIHAKKDSMLNTPPVFPIYILSKILRWMDGLGGLEIIEKSSEEKAALLYSSIDNSGGYYRCPVQREYRSIMNVVFQLLTLELEKMFLDEAALNGLVNLKGHRSVGGCRASIYNAMPRSSVEVLVDFMQEFQATHST